LSAEDPASTQDPESESEPAPAPAPAQWWLYLLRSPSGRSYVGITIELARRLEQHNGERPGGAKSTRGGRPWAIARSWGPFSHQRAAQLEYRLKRIRGRRRLDWQPPSEDSDSATVPLPVPAPTD